MGILNNSHHFPTFTRIHFRRKKRTLKEGLTCFATLPLLSNFNHRVAGNERRALPLLSCLGRKKYKQAEKSVLVETIK